MKNEKDMKGTISRAFGWDFIGITFVSLSSFLVIIIGVNFLGEAKMGIFAYILTLQGYFTITIQLGFDPTIRRFFPRFSNNIEKFHALNQRLIAIRIILLLALIFVSILGLILWPDDITSFLKLDKVYIYFLIFFISIYGISDYLQTLYIAYYYQKELHSINILTESLKLVLLLIFLYLIKDIYAVLFAFSAFYILRNILLFIKSPLSVKSLFGAFSLKSNLNSFIGSIVTTKRIIQYASIAYMQRWFIFIAGRDLDLLMVGLLISGQMGLAAEFIFIYKFSFDLAEQSQSILLKGISGGFSHNLISEYFEKKDFDKLQKIYTGLFEILCLTTLPISIGLAIIIPDLVVLLIPEPKFESSHAMIIQLVTLFSLSYPFFKLAHIPGTFFPATDKEVLLLKTRFFFSLMNISGNLTLLYVFNLSIFSFAISTCGVGVLLFLTESSLLNFKLNLKFPYIKFLKFYISAIIMGMILLGVRDGLESVWYQFTLQGIEKSKIVLVINILIQVFLGAFVFFIGIIFTRPFSEESLSLLEKFPIPFKDKIIQLLKR
jgi:O-antigen/teichoic acid export membrane protein